MRDQNGSKQNEQQNEQQKRDAGALGARALLFLIAVCTSVGAVLCFRAGFAPGRLAPRICWVVGGSLSGVVSCLFWFFFSASLYTPRRNLFLYDRGTKTEIPVEQLTWETVDDRLAGCFAYYFANRRRLSVMPEVLHPLFMPFYLLQFGEAGDEDVDRLLKNKEMIDSAAVALNALGLDDDGRQLLYHFGAYTGDPVPFRAFLSGVSPRIRDKIMKYVRTHIDSFV